ncbi:hypothetical protein KKE48_01535 [Patescibacteria group bacterium]|nr:hypothetical protein [Patescibacteria group bacterium]MBU1499532.1 hypothetical protein [Patescibacteria group bacterium]
MIKEEPGIEPLQLNIVETCPNKPENYCWQKEAWFDGQVHPIESVGASEVISKEDNDGMPYTYKIGPFVFQDETAAKATGAHFIIPEGKANNVILFTGKDYKWRIRAVSGSGWILAWHPDYGVQQAWLSPDLGKNPIIEFGENWITCLIASPDCGEFILEGVDIPEYKPETEQALTWDTHSPALTSSRGRFLFPLYEFWDAFDRLGPKLEKDPFDTIGP